MLTFYIRNSVAFLGCKCYGGYIVRFSQHANTLVVQDIEMNMDVLWLFQCPFDRHPPVLNYILTNPVFSENCEYMPILCCFLKSRNVTLIFCFLI